MKKPPYHEIINLKAERKEYAFLCVGQSQKFKVYSEWEEHIKDRLSTFNSSKDLYNFKRYCINIARVQEKAPDMFLGYAGLLLTVYVDVLFKDIPFYVMPIAFFVLLCYVIVQNKKLTKESCFYKDLVEIIEGIEKEKELE